MRRYGKATVQFSPIWHSNSPCLVIVLLCYWKYGKETVQMSPIWHSNCSCLVIFIFVSCFLLIIVHVCPLKGPWSWWLVNKESWIYIYIHYCVVLLLLVYLHDHGHRCPFLFISKKMFGNIPFKIHLLLGCFLPYYVIFVLLKYSTSLLGH
jgi:hypothetical protein